MYTFEDDCNSSDEVEGKRFSFKEELIESDRLNLAVTLSITLLLLLLLCRFVAL